MNRMVLALVTALALSSSTPAFAQGSTVRFGKAFVSVNGGLLVASNDFNDSATFPENAEEGTLTSDYTVEGGPALNIAGGAIVWRQIAVGAGVTRLSRSTPVVVQGSIPHPFFFNRPRTVTSDVAGLTREELGVNIRISRVFPLGTRLQAMVFGGPSFFQVKQGVVTDIAYADDYPYDEARFVQAETTGVNASSIGFNAGADLAFFFTRQLGVGMVAQLSRGTVDLPAAGGGTQSVKVGGMLAGGGLRLRF